MYKRQAIKDVGRETSMFFARCIVALFIVFILMVVLISRQFKLQVLDYQKYQTQSENNRISIQSVAPVRGLIYDRDGKLLAQNRSIFTLEITPEQTRDLPKLVEELRKVLTISDEQVLKFLEQIKFRPKFNSYVLKSNLTEEEVAKFSVVQHMYPGASLEARLERYYPYKGDLVHVLGRMGAINVEELEAMDEETRLRYAATSKIGKLGLERYYESILHGEVGSQRVETDVRGVSFAY